MTHHNLEDRFAEYMSVAVQEITYSNDNENGTLASDVKRLDSFSFVRDIRACKHVYARERCPVCNTHKPAAFALFEFVCLSYVAQGYTPILSWDNVTFRDSITEIEPNTYYGDIIFIPPGEDEDNAPDEGWFLSVIISTHYL